MAEEPSDPLYPPAGSPSSLKRTPARKVAAGTEAVTSSLGHTIRQSGFFRGNKLLFGLNQATGFDCPSCAWPDPSGERSPFEYCENGAKAVAWEATKRRVTPEFFARHSIPDLLRQSDHWLENQGRLTHPMLRRPGSDHYEPIDWVDAFAIVAQHLRTLDSPHEAVFYTSGRTSNEAAFLYQLFVRSHGTNNLPDCSNMCHESSGLALSETIGVGKGTVSLEDLHEAEAIFIFGQNPGTNHPRMLAALQKAVRNGCEIVAINPLREAGLLAFSHPQELQGLMGFKTPLASQFLQIRINGDLAAIQGLNKALLEAEARNPGRVLDHDFINAHTSGLEALRAHLATISWKTIEQASGLSHAELQKAARLAIRSQKTICCWAMGLTQHHNSVAIIQEVVNFLLLRGNLGKPGAGACPVRGHSNVQGDRTMGIWEKMPAPFLDALDREFGITSPRSDGFDTVESIKAMRDGRAKVFFAMGGNFLAATPDTARTASALRACDLTVQVSTKLNRSHLVTGRCALILPCLGRTERDDQASGPQFVSTENSMGVVHRSQGALEPASELLKSEPAIVYGLAKATFGNDHPVPWQAFSDNYDMIRDAISRVVPGFENYNRRVRVDGGFRLPNSARDLDFSKIGGRAKFTVHPFESIELEPGQLLLMTIRSHDQFNTTIYGMDDRYRGIRNERRVIFMHREDMAKHRIVAEQPVDITSHFRGEKRVARMFLAIPYDIPRNCAAAYFPETNALVPLDSTARGSNTPTSKSIIITVTPSRP